MPPIEQRLPNDGGATSQLLDRAGISSCARHEDQTATTTAATVAIAVATSSQYTLAPHLIESDFRAAIL